MPPLILVNNDDDSPGLEAAVKAVHLLGDIQIYGAPEISFRTPTGLV